MKRSFMTFLRDKKVKKQLKKLKKKKPDMSSLVRELTLMFNHWYRKRNQIWFSGKDRRKANAHVNMFMMRKWVTKIELL